MVIALRRANAWVTGHKLPTLLGLGVVLVLVAIPTPARATFTTALVNFIQFTLGWLYQLYVSLMASILLLLINILIKVAGYNNFIHATAVTQGWVIVRDVVNMFFILVLLLIAFATIFGKEEYGIKYLPKLLIMAVVINFSKTIVGVFIDISQVIMLTFVNGFSQIAGGNFVQALNIKDLLAVEPQAGAPLGGFEIVIALGLASILITVAVGVVFAMLWMLLWRIIMLWMLTVLSPLAFFAGAVPFDKAQKAYADWWENLTNYLILGPALAFFLWLTLIVVGTGQGADELKVNNPLFDRQISGGEAARLESKSGLGASVSPNEVNVIASAAGQENKMINFVIAVGMLFASIVLANEFGEAGAKFGSGLARAQIAGKGGLGLGKGLLRAGWRGAKKGGAVLDDRYKWRERALTGAGNMAGGIPLAGTALRLAAFNAAAGIRGKKAAKTKATRDQVRNYTDDQIQTMLNTHAKSPPAVQTQEYKATMAGAMLESLTRKDMYNDQSPGAEEQRRKNMGELTGLSKELGDEDLKKKVAEVKEARPDWAMEPDKADDIGKTINNAEKGGGVGVPDVRKMSERAFKNKSMIDVTNPDGTVRKPMTSSDALVAGLSNEGRAYAKQHKGGEVRKIIEDWEARSGKVTGADAFGSAKNDAERADRYNGLSNDGKASIPTADQTAPLLAAIIAGAGAGGAVAALQPLIKVGKLNVANLNAAELNAGNGELAGEIALSGKSDQIDAAASTHPTQFVDGLSKRLAAGGMGTEDERKIRAAILRASGSIPNSFGGMAGNPAVASHYTKSIREDPSLLTKFDVDPGTEPTNRAVEMMLNDRSTIRVMARSAKTNDERSRVKMWVAEVLAKKGTDPRVARVEKMLEADAELSDFL